MNCVATFCLIDLSIPHDWRRGDCFPQRRSEQSFYPPQLFSYQAIRLSEVSILSRIFSEGSPIAVAHIFIEYHSSEEKEAIDLFLDPIYEKQEISAFEIPCYFPDGQLGSPVQAGVTFYRLRVLQ